MSYYAILANTRHPGIQSNLFSSWANMLPFISLEWELFCASVTYELKEPLHGFAIKCRM